MTATTMDFWSGDGGVEYTQRNRVDWTKRVPFWTRMLDLTNAGAFLEVGCNAGWNLEAIRSLRADAAMTGVDINEVALREAQAKGLDVEVCPGDRVAELLGHACCDMAFTCGVLIHVPPDDLRQTMLSIVDASGQFVLAVEYEAQEEQEIVYRDRVGLLWKRPYGQLYQAMGLSLVETGVAEGFDACTYWLLEK